MSDIALRWDGTSADLALTPVTVERITYALLFGGAGRASAGDVLDVGTDDFSVELNFRPDATGRVQPLVSKYGAEHYLSLPGASGAHYASALAAGVTGDLDVRARVALDEWGRTARDTLVAQWGTLAADRAWALTTNGANFRLEVNNAAVSYQVAIPVSFVDGVARWVRATVDIDNGSGGSTATFYESGDGSTWTSMGSVTGALVTAITGGSAPVLVGSLNETLPMAGKAYHVEVRAGIDGARARCFDADDFDVGATSALSSRTGETWTLSGRVKLRATGSYWMACPGSAGSYASAPSIGPPTTGLDIVARVSADDWTPATQKALVGHATYGLYLNTAGAWTLSVALDSGSFDFDGPALGYANGSTHWIRVSIVLDNGSGDSQADFYDSADGASWTFLGSATQTTGAVAFDPPFPSTLRVAADGVGASPWAGKVFALSVSNNIGGDAELGFDAEDADVGATSFDAALTGQTLTLGGAAVIAGEATGGWALFLNEAGLLRLRLLDAEAHPVAGNLAASAWSIGEVHHLVVALDRDGSAACYRNGVLAGSLAISIAQASLSNSAAFLFADRYDGAISLQGLLDDARLYLGRVLTAQDAADHYRGVFGSETGLEALWDFDEGAGIVAHETTGSSHHLALTGSPSWVVTGTKDVVTGHSELELDNGLETAVLLSLFTDRRADPGDALPDPADSDRRGWWGDALPVVDGDHWGSKLWLLSREKETQAVVDKARQYAAEALAWLTEDLVAESVEVTASIVRPGVLGLAIVIQRPSADPVSYRYNYAWAAQAARQGA